MPNFVRTKLGIPVRQSSIEFDKLHERLPELSPSELKICNLILKEIIKILGKSESNITCQRTNIRAKLAMQPKDNLLNVLKKRMESLEQIIYFAERQKYGSQTASSESGERTLNSLDPTRFWDAGLGR